MTWFEDHLAQQLKTTAQTWAAMQQHGATEQSVLRLDFFYDATSPEPLQRLKTWFDEQTDYESEVVTNRTGLTRKRHYSLAGTTQLIAVSEEALLKWVEQMVTTGAEHGPAVFDGFSAVVS